MKVTRIVLDLPGCKTAHHESVANSMEVQCGLPLFLVRTECLQTRCRSASDMFYKLSVIFMSLNSNLSVLEGDMKMQLTGA
jgi:hypothetical protein